VNLTAEARYTKDERTIDINRFDLRTRLPTNPTRFDVGGANSPEDVSYTLSAGWKFAPAWLLYGKLGTAFRAGNFNTDLGDPRGLPIPIAYDDEDSTTYELGLKGNITPAWYTALTTYQINTTNALVQRDNGLPAVQSGLPRPAHQLSGERRRRGDQGRGAGDDLSHGAIRRSPPPERGRDPAKRRVHRRPRSGQGGSSSFRSGRSRGT
jgi:outer membrane receptor protein involved in Fe transport